MARAPRCLTYFGTTLDDEEDDDDAGTKQQRKRAKFALCTLVDEFALCNAC